MDYVVAGFGIGAVLALIGFALWELFGESEEPGQGWLRRSAIGLMIGALVIWAVTGVSLLSTIDDSTGSHLVLLTTLVALVAIAAGSIWYWRADQALVASLPPQQRIQQPKAQKEVTAKAASIATGSAVAATVELSDWDSWPERDAGASSDTAESAPVAEVSFEPEVAAEPAATVESADAAATGTVGEAASETDVVMAEVPIDTAIENTTETAVESAVEIAEQPVESAADDTEIVVDQIEVLESETIEVEPQPVDLPSNVHPIRAVVPDDLPGLEPVKAQPEISPKVVRLPDPETVVENIVAESVVAEVEELDEPVVPASDSPVAPPAPVAFESSILADIDLTNAEGNKRYQSPILADLEQNPDELEGIGLAKWRPEARLTSENENEAPIAKRQRRR